MLGVVCAALIGYRVIDSIEIAGAAGRSRSDGDRLSSRTGSARALGQLLGDFR